MQIQSILKKDAIMEEYESNITPDSIKCHRGSVCDEINDNVCKWYSLARQRNVPVSGPMMQEEARLIAAHLGNHDFKASNGWLQSFKKRHNLKQLKISGEAADVGEEVVEAWYERLKAILEGYKAEDIWE